MKPRADPTHWHATYGNGPECGSSRRDDSRFRVQSHYVGKGQAPLPRGDHVGLLEAPDDANRGVPDLQRFNPRLRLTRSGFVQKPLR